MQSRTGVRLGHEHRLAIARVLGGLDRQAPRASGLLLRLGEDAQAAALHGGQIQALVVLAEVVLLDTHEHEAPVEQPGQELLGRLDVVELRAHGAQGVVDAADPADHVVVIRIDLRDRAQCGAQALDELLRLGLVQVLGQLDLYPGLRRGRLAEGPHDRDGLRVAAGDGTDVVELVDGSQLAVVVAGGPQDGVHHQARAAPVAGDPGVERGDQVGDVVGDDQHDRARALVQGGDQDLAALAVLGELAVALGTGREHVLAAPVEILCRSAGVVGPHPGLGARPRMPPPSGVLRVCGRGVGTVLGLCHWGITPL